MINLRIPPKNPEELYEFFMYGLPLPPVKSHVAYVGGIQCIREDWVIDGYLDRYSRCGLFFRYRESDSPSWYEQYEKYKL